MKLEGKVAIITGGARGNGLATAKLMAEEGADIVITDICENMNTIPYDMSTEETMAGAVESIKAMGRKALGVKCDVRKFAEIEAMVEQVMETFGKIDILVNNAGTNHRVPVLEFPEEAWDLILNTNLKGYFLVAQAVAPQMLERGYGKIINMGSILGRIALPNQVAYASAKGGVEQMTKVMALEWAKQGVRVNAIGPTYFETEMVKEISEDHERFNFINERTPMGRWGHLPELEGIVVFLAAPASDFITGQTIYIDGGWTAC